MREACGIRCITDPTDQRRVDWLDLEEEVEAASWRGTENGEWRRLLENWWIGQVGARVRLFI